MIFKGQGRVGAPKSVPMVFIVFNLGIVGDEKTHKYPLYRASIGISHRGTLGSGYIQLSPEIVHSHI